MTANMEQFRDHFEAMRADPVVFVRMVIGVEPSEQQSEVLRALAKPGAKVTVSSGHGTGKSTLLAWAVLRFVSLFANCKVPCTAPTSHQLEDVLWAELAKWHERMQPWWREQIVVDSKRVHLKGKRETQFAVARTARRENPEALQGFHAENLLFVADEASGIHDNIFEVAQGALSTEHARVIMTANPTQTSGYFFQSHHKMKARWTRFTLSCLDSPLVGQEYIDDMRDSYGEESDQYRVRVLGLFPNASIRQLITRDLCDAASTVKMNPSQYSFAPKVLGVDVAWEGDDRSALFLRQGLRAQLLGEWHTIDNMTFGGIIDQAWHKHQVDACFIDVGWGTGVIDFLRSISRDPIPVNFGGKSISAEYVNKRTEMWCELKKWLESGGQIPDNKDLIEDLVGPEYSFASNGRKSLERKVDMKKRGFCSPDLADALALTFAAPVYKAVPHEVDRLLVGASGKVVCKGTTDYDPFA